MDQTNVIPLLDISLIGLDKASVSDDDLRKVGLQLKEAFSVSGFCYTRNHGIDIGMVDRYMATSRDFFEQSVDVKEKYARDKLAEDNFGWIAREAEILNPERPAGLRESFNFTIRGDAGDSDGVADFLQGTRAMFGRCKELAARMYDALSLGLGLDMHFMRDAHKGIGGLNNASTLRSLYYPQLGPEVSIKPGQVRCGEHTDFDTLSILFQDDIGGLEVEIPGKGFVAATPIPGTAVVNIGEIMQRWTSDELVATKHRVMIPEAEDKNQRMRQSFVFFLDPDNDYVVKCLDGSDKYKPVTYIEYLQSRVGTTY